MNGRRDLPRPRQGARRLVSINGMIFQRGNPMDYERWARRPGHGDVGLPPLPALLQADGDLPAPGADARGAAAAGRSCSSAARPTNPLFGAFFEAAQQAGYPLTDDVNGYRQEGFARFDRNIHRGRRLSRRPRLPAPGDGPQEPHGRDPARSPPRSRFEGKRAVGVDYLRAGRLQRTVAAGEVILCGGAINTPQLLQLSGVGDADAPRAARRRRGRTTCPGVGENLQDHLEVYIQYASQAAGLDRARPASGATARRSATSGCSTAAGSAPPTTSRAAASPAATRTSTTPT